MILLAAGLPDLHFQAGLPIPGAETSSPSAPVVQTAPPAVKVLTPWLLQTGLALSIILFSFALITLLVRKASIKRIAILAAGLVILFAIFSLLPPGTAQPPDALPSNASPVQPPSFQYEVAPIGSPPASWSVWIIAGAALIAAGLTAWLLVRAFRQPHGDPLAQAAQTAIQAIQAGQNLSNIIIRCYLGMESVVAQDKGIERADPVTPREFETYLADQGIPRLPVLQLTRLFEKARYGNQALDQQDEQEAIRCLSAIQAACQPGERGTR